MRMKKNSSNNEFSVFEFNEEDELVEMTSRKLLRKYRNKCRKFGSDSDPITRYNFLQRFAHGAKSLINNLMNERSDVDDVAKETSSSSNHKPNTPIGVDSDDDGSPELHSSKLSSTLEGLRELRVNVHDPNWPKKQEEIKSLDVRYNDVWNVASDVDASVSEDVLPGQNSNSRSKHHSVNFSESSLDESFEEIIYPKGEPDAVTITKRDVERLQPETFLNDTIIDFYILYLKNNVKAKEVNRFQFFNSFFFRKLADLDKDPSRACESTEAFKRVRKWTRKLDIFDKDYIFVPVNFSLHWSLIVICHPGEVVNFQDEETENNGKNPCILHMDSIKGSHRGLKNLIRSYLFEEWKERYNGPVEYASSKFHNLQFVPLEVPQQENLFDCGLFLLHYAELFLEQAPVNFSYSKISNSKFLSKEWFPPKEASSKRGYIKRLIYEIVKDNSPKVNPSFKSLSEAGGEEEEEEEEEETGLEFLLEIRSSSHGSCSDSDANHDGLELTPNPAVSLRNGPYIRRSKSVDSEDNDAVSSPTATFSQNSWQIVPFNFLKNVNSPIEEGEEENEEQSANLVKDESSEKRVAEVSEPLALEASQKHSKSVISSGTNENSELLTCKNREHKTICESCSSSIDEFSNLVVEDSEEESQGYDDVIARERTLRLMRIRVEGSDEVNRGYDDVIKCQSSPRPTRIRVKDSDKENGGDDDVIVCESIPQPRRVGVEVSNGENGGDDDVIMCESTPWVKDSEEGNGEDDVIECESTPWVEEGNGGDDDVIECESTPWVKDFEEGNGGDDDVIECESTPWVKDSEEGNGGDDDVIECESSHRPRKTRVEDSEEGNGGGDDVIDCESSPRRRRFWVEKGGDDDVIDCESQRTIEKIDLTGIRTVVSVLKRRKLMET